MTAMPPGWYPAEGDPPDTQRYWNGSQWQGGPQPMMAAPPPNQYSSDGNALTALILACLGLLVCQLLSPVAMVMANRQRKAIDAGVQDPSDRTMVTVAFWLGVAGTVLTVLAFAVGLFFLIAAILNTAGSASPYGG